MFKNVLVGVDGSANGRDAIALASQLVDPDGKITLAHVHRGDLDPLKAVAPGLLKSEREASSELLHQERTATGVEAELRDVIASSVGAGLHAQAELQSADLLVVGSCRHGALGRAVLGDNARAALNGAPCAVAIAASGYRDHGDPARIGVAYDGTAESEAALRAAREVAEATGALIQLREVAFLPVAYTGLYAAGFDSNIERVIDDTEKRLREIPAVTCKAVYGPIEIELEAFSNEVDLLAVGSRGYGPLKRLMLGSTANHLARHAGCSLLVLPRAATSQEAGAHDPAPSAAVGV